MKKVQIPKKSGGTRTIYVQGPTEKHKYRLLGQELSEFYEKNEAAPNLAHGFVQGRSPVSNALCHTNKKYTLTIDLKNFFDTVTPKHLQIAGVDNEKSEKVCIDGATRQGLSSSPAAANCAAIPLDKLILKTILAEKMDVVYTRYADDMCFSSDKIEDLLLLKDKVPELVKIAGFEVNLKKTRIQSSNFGRRIITGIAVDDKIYATKNQRKILRAAKHNVFKLKRLLFYLVQSKNHLWFAILLEINRKNISKYLGMKEWCLLKPPTKSLGGKCYTTMVNAKTKDAFKDFAA